MWLRGRAKVRPDLYARVGGGVICVVVSGAVWRQSCPATTPVWDPPPTPHAFVFAGEPSELQPLAEPKPWPWPETQPQPQPQP